VIVFAHLGHWYSAFGFLVPAALVVAWVSYQARRDRRRTEFVEDWTLELRDGDWRVESVQPVESRRRRRRPRPERVRAAPTPDRSVS
jgi:hypothetical protein